MVTHTLLPLSEQHLIDCDVLSAGCSGGSLANAYNYIVQNDGIAKASDYPYTGVKGKCREDAVDQLASISDYHIVDRSESALVEAVSQQPVSVGIKCGGRFTKKFKQYKGGIFAGDVNGECGTGFGHAITIIGYNQQNYVPFWIAKNSWGTSWGEGGYIRIAMGRNEDGVCGINQFAVYPVPWSI